jgi:hypothetical protein
MEFNFSRAVFCADSLCPLCSTLVSVSGTFFFENSIGLCGGYDQSVKKGDDNESQQGKGQTIILQYVDLEY